MKLLQKVFLSTALMMVTTFGTSTTLPDGTNAGDSTGVRTDAEAFANSLIELREEQAQYLSLLQQITRKVHIGEVAIGSTGEFVSYIKALSKGLNALIRERNELVAERDSLQEAVETSSAAHSALVVEKEAADHVLVGLRVELETAIRSLETKTASAATASARVELLTAELESAQKAAVEASEEARRHVEQFTRDLEAANEEAGKLTVEVERLIRENAALENQVKNAEAVAARLQILAEEKSLLQQKVAQNESQIKFLSDFKEAKDEEERKNKEALARLKENFLADKLATDLTTKTSESDPLDDIIELGSYRDLGSPQSLLGSLESSPGSPPMATAYQKDSPSQDKPVLNEENLRKVREEADRLNRITELKRLYDLPQSKGMAGENTTEGSAQTHTTKTQRAMIAKELEQLGVKADTKEKKSISPASSQTKARK